MKLKSMQGPPTPDPGFKSKTYEHQCKTDETNTNTNQCMNGPGDTYYRNLCYVDGVSNLMFSMVLNPNCCPTCADFVNHIMRLPAILSITGSTMLINM